MAHQFAIKSYFDPEEMIMQEEKLSLTMPVGAFLLGLEFAMYNSGGGGPATSGPPSSSTSALGPTTTEHVPRDTKFTVPLWAGHTLRMHGFANIAVPESCTYSAFREFRQDPMGPNIRVKSPFFFELAADAASIVPPQEGTRLRSRLVELYRKRYPSVLMVGNRKGLDLSEIKNTLSNAEKKIVERTIENNQSEKAWVAKQS